MFHQHASIRSKKTIKIPAEPARRHCNKCQGSKRSQRCRLSWNVFHFFLLIVSTRATTESQRCLQIAIYSTSI